MPKLSKEEEQYDNYLSMTTEQYNQKYGRVKSNSTHINDFSIHNHRNGPIYGQPGDTIDNKETVHKMERALFERALEKAMHDMPLTSEERDILTPNDKVAKKIQPELSNKNKEKK
jgi:hypothetical protein